LGKKKEGEKPSKRVTQLPGAKRLQKEAKQKRGGAKKKSFFQKIG